jgi:predicted dehydrogenase
VPAVEPLRIGLVGCGWVAQEIHLPTIERFPEATVVAATDVDAGRLEHVARRFSIARTYPNPTELLADPAIEAIAVCAPVRFHGPIALQSLEAGKNLFVEKPLALSLEACDELIAAAQSASQVVMVGHNLRFLRLVRQARAIIDAGQLGNPKAIRTAMTSANRFHSGVPEWTQHRVQGGGALIERPCTRSISGGSCCEGRSKRCSPGASQGPAMTSGR